jgi:ribonuclease R
MPSPWSKRSEDLRTRRSPDDGGQRIGRGVKKGEGAPPLSRRDRVGDTKGRQHSGEVHESLPGPIPEEVLHEIAEECSTSERRADEAERELMEWKKVKFMADRVGEDFDGLIISVTKFGFFVELTDMFIEGLVPLTTLHDDRYFYNDSTKQIIGGRSKKAYSLGDKVRVLVDRIDPVEKKINFAIVEEEPSRAEKKHRKRG